jgi:prephenate dehydrogenase
MFKRLALIGCGLMGGSFALAARQAGLVAAVCGYSRSEKSARRAQKLGIVQEVAASPAEAAHQADLVLLAVPVASTRSTLEALVPGLGPDTLVMDVGSTKADVVQAAREALGPRIGQFVPAHPICGKEVAGIDHADARLYQGQQVIVTPLAQNTAQRIDQARAIWTALGCQVRTMDPDTHDRALAAISHFPHLMAFAFMGSLMKQPEGERYLSVAGPGFRDTTRIAAGDPELWTDVLMANASEVLAQSRHLHESLSELERLVQQGDRQALRRYIEAVSRRRSHWQMGRESDAP